jgi:hypothetical protein
MSNAVHELHGRCCSLDWKSTDMSFGLAQDKSRLLDRGVYLMIVTLSDL